GRQYGDHPDPPPPRPGGRPVRRSGGLTSRPVQDVVIGVDASTTAVKAIAFERSGRELVQARYGYPLSTPAPGHFEQDAEDWWNALVAALADVTQAIGPDRIAAVSIAHQRETFVAIDATGSPLAPGILWLDERARAQVARLSAELGREA